MFVALSAVCCALSARQSLEHDGSWRLACSKSCQQSGRTAAACCLHWRKTKAAQSADVAGHSCYFGCAMTIAEMPNREGKENRQDATQVWCAHWDKQQSRKNSADVGRGSTVGCLQFVFQLIPRPPSEGRDGQLWDEPDERTACIVPRF